MILTLVRSIMSPDLPTQGILTLDQAFPSIEQPWRNNLADHSCVPVGVYQLIPYYSPKHGQTWYLLNPALNIYGPNPPIGGRSMSEIHAANLASQLEGCIAPGTAAGQMADPANGGQMMPAVLNSQLAMTEIRRILGPMTAGHTLEITAAAA